MSEIRSSIFLIAPFLLAALIPLLATTWVAVGSRVTWIWVAAYFVCIFYFPNASWGIVNQTTDSNFYNRGTGTFYFSAINILLFGLVLQALVARTWVKTSIANSNLGIPALLFWFILIGNALVGYLTPEIHWYEIIGLSGLMNIANFMLAFYILTTSIRTPQDLDKIINILLFCAVSRGLWGVIRFLAMGGDPANFYSNFQKIDVTLTFFDINDSLVATLALFITAWRLATETSLSTGRRFTYYAIVLLELFIIVFSYRRTAWGGLALAAILFAFCQPKKQRYGLLLGFISIGLPAIIYKMIQRSGQSSYGVSFIERVLPDIASGGQLRFTTGRFSELYAAYLSYKESPLWGLGAWGRYDGSRFSELAWHNGDFGWMHSGVMHLALKSGILGVGISIAVFIGLIRYVIRNKGDMPKAQLGIMMAGLGGILFMLPNWLIGTPVIEFRTMQLMAFSFALPYMAFAATKKQAA